METNQFNSLNNSGELHGEDNHFTTQYLLTYNSFFQQPQSMKELSVTSGIDRANLCRYVRTMRLLKAIAVYKRSHCSITKRLVNKYTTNPDLFPNYSPQIKMFE